MAHHPASLHAKSPLAGLRTNFLERSGIWPISQLLTGHRGRMTRTFACLSLLTVAACGPSQSAAPASGSARPVRGGEIVTSFRSEPASFNRLMARDTSTSLVSLLTQARLVRVNQVTQEVEPQLAESWTAADDGRRVTMALRRGVQFSDGHPFTSADVLFSFAAVYDPKVGSILADSLQAVGRNLEVSAPDDHTVVITFPVAFGPGLRILDALPIFPRHKLEASLAAGTFGKAWGLTTPLADLAGLGPFVLSEYQPGQRLVFDRNPRYFGKAPDGTQLPYLDRLVV